MDFTNRQIDIISIIRTEEKASLSKIRGLLPETISIPTLRREIDKLLYQKVLHQIGRGKAKYYALSDNYK